MNERTRKKGEEVRKSRTVSDIAINHFRKDSEEPRQETDKGSNLEKERRECFIRDGGALLAGQDGLRKDGLGTSRLRKYLQDEGLGSPGLVLGRTERSRSEEAEKEIRGNRRPRHRSISYFWGVKIYLLLS